jgi:hypothetical protein
MRAEVHFAPVKFHNNLIDVLRVSCLGESGTPLRPAKSPF